MSIILVAMLLGAAPAPASADLLRETRELIASRGAEAALATIFADETRWASLVDAIATGGQEWLSVAASLHAVSDAGASEGLAMAVQEALPHNPEAVLELVAAGSFSIQQACGMYGFGQIEDERPLRVLLGLVARRVRAVTAVKPSKLAGVRHDCLQELEALGQALEGKAG